MRVEVTEENILKYGLVQLTGNTVEELLTAAEEAREAGYILACQIPDDDLIHMNAFEAAGSTPVDPDEVEYQNRIMDPEPGSHRGGRVIEVIVGEVLDSHIEKE